MRTPVLPIAALLLLSPPAEAQLHAGEIPPGASALDMDINLVLNTPFTIDMAGLEVDCDDQPDMTVTLIYGQPAIDAPNVAQLNLVDDDLEVCADPPGFQQRPQYYDFDQLLECTGDFDWHSDNLITLGDFGSFNAIGPTSIDHKYVAYRRGTQVGWILLSFEVAGDVTVRLQVHQVLPICPIPTSIPSHDLSPTVSLFPNPGHGEPIRVESADPLHGIEVLDPSGRLVASYAGTLRTIPAPEVAGTYLVRVSHADGGRSITKWIRY